MGETFTLNVPSLTNKKWDERKCKENLRATRRTCLTIRYDPTRTAKKKPKLKPSTTFRLLKSLVIVIGL